MIYYDRACKLHTFFLTREPAFVRDTIFRVDSLHFPNHTGCSAGYNPSVYKGRTSLSTEQSGPVNTQACEQINAQVKVVKRFVSFRTMGGFLIYMRTFLQQRNIARLPNIPRSPSL